MSQSGKSPAAVIDPPPPQGEEDRSLNHDPTGHEHGHEHEHDHDGHEDHEAGHAKDSGPRLPFAHLSASAKSKWRRETRFGVAALLSFVILVSVLIMNKGRNGKAKPGEKPPKTVAMAIGANTESTTSEGTQSEETPAPTPAPSPAETPAAPAERPPGETSAPTPPETSPANSSLPPLPESEPKPPGPDAGSKPAAQPEPGKPSEEGGAAAGGDSSPAPLPPVEPASETPQANAPPSAPPPIPDPVAGPEATAPNEPPKEQAPPVPPGDSAPSGPMPAPQDAPALPLAADAAPPLPTRDAETPAPAPAQGPGDSATTLLPPGVSNAPEPPAATPSPDPGPSPSKSEPPPTPPAEVAAPGKLAAEEVAPAPMHSPPPASPAPAPPAQLEQMPNLTKAPPSTESPVPESAPPAFKPGTGIPIPNAGKGRTFEEGLATAAGPVAAGTAALATAGRSNSSAPAEEDVVEPVPHVVRRGENFYTIAKEYYGQGRYWKALWNANKDIVPDPYQLWVGTTIRIPPPESLDRSVIEPPRLARSSVPSNDRSAPVRRTSQSAPAGAARPESQIRRSSEKELALPIADPFVTQRIRSRVADDAESVPEVRGRSSRPRYLVRGGETLRSIARDTLGNSHRDNDILELNRDIIDDPTHLVEGQYLELPEDARLGRRSR